VIACGALARELRAVLTGLPASDGVRVEYLPAHLHNTPDAIPAAVARLAGEHAAARVVVAYGDCGTGGRLDATVDALGAVRLPGAHCYELYAGAAPFDSLMTEEPGTFFLTDFLARHFDALVVGTLGLDAHPELRDVYFAHYRRVVLLSQSDDPEVVTAARRAADRLGLPLEVAPTGLAALADALGAAIGARVTA
jgi:hypothetical protein